MDFHSYSQDFDKRSDLEFDFGQHNRHKPRFIHEQRENEADISSQMYLGRLSLEDIDMEQSFTQMLKS